MDVDIITYHPIDTKEVRFNRRQYHQATDRGIFFEIPYAFMLRDSSMRKKIIQISHQYHAVGKSRVRLLQASYNVGCLLYIYNGNVICAIEHYHR